MFKLNIQNNQYSQDMLRNAGQEADVHCRQAQCFVCIKCKHAPRPVICASLQVLNDLAQNLLFGTELTLAQMI